MMRGTVLDSSSSFGSFGFLRCDLLKVKVSFILVSEIFLQRSHSPELRYDGGSQ
jgi:hypothetical protein